MTTTIKAAPTNDLDVETLEVLEQRLVEYQGTLIVVSHDREFLDNVVTSILVFEADGSIREYVGGYSDWVRRHRELAAKDDPDKARQRAKNDASRDERPKPTKLSYQQQRELDALPGRIENLEAEIEDLQAIIALPDFYARAHEEVQSVLKKLDGKSKDLENEMESWLTLEKLREEFTRS